MQVTRPLPAFGVPVPVCSRCFDSPPLSLYREGECENCSTLTDGVGERETELRAAIRKLPVPGSDDITAYHLEGMHYKALSLPQATFLSSYRLPESDVPTEAAEAVGVFYGAEGSRANCAVKVLSVVPLPPGDFGDRYLVVFSEKETQARLVWFTGENCWCEEGWEGTIRGTIKKHDVYAGRRQTVLQRVQEVTT